MGFPERSFVQVGRNSRDRGIMAAVPEEHRQLLLELKQRAKQLETPRPTSPLFSKAGWPLLGVGLVLTLVEIVIPHTNFLLLALAAILLVAGIFAVAMSLFSAHSEGLEETERSRRIRERSTSARCLYLEGLVPDGKGSVGRCRLYEFDMVDLPYCLYCKEFAPAKGNPEV
jgi:hypothetical protein